ncbi:hypothetical protein GQX73_g10059 [Xylaria multiplex]|uniref:Uncharacterized protein n=1 Tax=Xylaria multiplex TaxID=323545 RepID=A0A7C8MKE6_9PEZI|nr:hypothetical protein GQX73_g10059 [Xylaria multiplex]
MPVLNPVWSRQAITLQRTAPRAARPLISPLSHLKPPAHTWTWTQVLSRRFQSTDSKPPVPSPANPSSTTPHTHRISRILTSASRFLPKRLQSSLQNLRSAPFSHVCAFFVLHEITAILPILGLTYAFYMLDWVPTSWVLGPFAAWAEDGLKKYVPYFRQKNWFGFKDKDVNGSADWEEALENQLREEVEKERQREGREGGWFVGFSRGIWDRDPAGESAPTGSSGNITIGGDSRRTAAVWQKMKQAATVENTEKGYKIGIQIAAAYVITKFLLVPRIALSLWLTPWLARSFVGFRQAVRRKRS